MPPDPISDPLALLLRDLEDTPALLDPSSLPARYRALEDLDDALSDLRVDNHAAQSDQALRSTALAYQQRLEDLNAAIYASLRDDFARGDAAALRRWFDLASPNATTAPCPGLGYDAADELLAGVLQLPEPDHEPAAWTPEMVFYQPTPVRHVLRLLDLIALTPDDLFVDLGSGLGHVPLLISMLTGTPTLGIEIEPSYVASAQECALSLGIRSATFCASDVREADLSRGTVFYLYTPFTGSILDHVLNKLEAQARARPLTLCSLGPCTARLAQAPWLQPRTPVDAEQITVFNTF